MLQEPCDSALSDKNSVLVAMGRQHRGAFVANLDTKIFSVGTSAGDLPVTRTDGRKPTCYLCCPSVAYIDYALEELRHFAAHPVLLIALKALVVACRPLMRLTGLDRQVQVNNWLLATNPLPDIASAELDCLTRDLIAAHPDHAIVWRSLNDKSDADALGRFRAAGFALFPARQIYLFDCRTAPPPQSRDARRDAALLSGSDYALICPEGIAEADYARIAELYGQLYLDKYTPLNPHYSAEFMAAAHRGGLISFFGLRRNGRLDGVVGFFEIGEVLTAPIVGYDTSLPQKLGLYRCLMAIGFARARERRMLFNMSAGAACFKRNRGGVPAIEYTAAYIRHLPAHRRLAAAIVRTLLEKLGETLLKRFEL